MTRHIRRHRFSIDGHLRRSPPSALTAAYGASTPRSASVGRLASDRSLENLVVRSTTVLAVLRDGKLAFAADGQVTVGNTILKAKATKIRVMKSNAVLSGFAGSTADALTLFEKFEGKIDEFNGNMVRAAVELAKEWRTDKMLRHLEALLLAGDRSKILTISGNGDVIETDDGVAAIGSGGPYALAAARAMLRETKLNAREIAEKALKIASEICVFTNENITVQEI
ncbi:MAG: ATP-dependent protease subunit HslV [Deltaproteobacteria bacterium]|nr:ATP-dependent protease subunit HslV [Deltaproteobacteria bacterium]MBI4374426.1 ATP-dependent protease subunit HslV [Deltaproteobacteria bacterium]